MHFEKVKIKSHYTGREHASSVIRNKLKHDFQEHYEIISSGTWLG